MFIRSSPWTYMVSKGTDPWPNVVIHVNSCSSFIWINTTQQDSSLWDRQLEGDDFSSWQHMATTYLIGLPERYGYWSHPRLSEKLAGTDWSDLVGGLEHFLFFIIFPYGGKFIIPTDELIFFRGVGILNWLVFPGQIQENPIFHGKNLRFPHLPVMDDTSPRDSHWNSPHLKPIRSLVPLSSNVASRKYPRRKWWVQ